MSKHSPSTFVCRRIIYNTAATNDNFRYHPSESPRGNPAQAKIAYRLHLACDTSSTSRLEQGSNIHRQHSRYDYQRREFGREPDQYIGRHGEAYWGGARRDLRWRRDFEHEQDRYEEERNKKLDEEDCNCGDCRVQRREKLVGRVHAWLARTEESSPRAR